MCRCVCSIWQGICTCALQSHTGAAAPPKYQIMRIVSAALPRVSANALARLTNPAPPRDGRLRGPAPQRRGTIPVQKPVTRDMSRVSVPYQNLYGVHPPPHLAPSHPDPCRLRAHSHIPTSADGDATSGNDNMAKMRIMRMMKPLRIFKLLRLLKASKSKSSSLLAPSCALALPPLEPAPSLPPLHFVSLTLRCYLFLVVRSIFAPVALSLSFPASPAHAALCGVISVSLPERARASDVDEVI